MGSGPGSEQLEAISLPLLPEADGVENLRTRPMFGRVCPGQRFVKISDEVVDFMEIGQGFRHLLGEEGVFFAGPPFDLFLPHGHPVYLQPTGSRLGQNGRENLGPIIRRVKGMALEQKKKIVGVLSPETVSDLLLQDCPILLGDQVRQAVSGDDPAARQVNAFHLVGDLVETIFDFYDVRRIPVQQALVLSSVPLWGIANARHQGRKGHVLLPWLNPNRLDSAVKPVIQGLDRRGQGGLQFRSKEIGVKICVFCLGGKIHISRMAETLIPESQQDAAFNNHVRLQRAVGNSVKNGVDGRPKILSYGIGFLVHPSAYVACFQMSNPVSRY